MSRISPTSLSGVNQWPVSRSVAEAPNVPTVDGQLRVHEQSCSLTRHSLQPALVLQRGVLPAVRQCLINRPHPACLLSH